MTLDEAIRRNPYNPEQSNKSVYCRYLRYNVDGWYLLGSKEVLRRWQKARITMTESERRSYNEGVASVWRAIAKVTPRKGDYNCLYNAVHGTEKHPNGFNVKIDLMSESEDKKIK